MTFYDHQLAIFQFKIDSSAQHAKVARLFHIPF